MTLLKKSIRFCLYMFAFLIIFSTYVILNPSKKEPVDLYVSAEGACKVAIERMANDPGTIQFFHSRNSSVIQKKDGVFVVTVPFRGKNRFNALILSETTCYLRHDGELWHILNVR